MALNYIAVAALSALLTGFPSLGIPGNAPDRGDGKAKEVAVEKHMCGGGYLGVMIDDVSKDEIAKLGLPEERGAKITKVMPESPAAKIGLQENDVIVKWNDVSVESAMQLGRLSQETPAGRTVNLTVIRGGQTLQLKPELAKRDDSFYRFEGGDVRIFEGKDGEFDMKIDEEDLKRDIEDSKRDIEDSKRDIEESKRDIEESVKELSALPLRMEGLRMNMGRMHHSFEGLAGIRPNFQITMTDSRFGAQVQNMSPALSKSFGVGEGKTAALVNDVDEASAAGKAGLRAGDVIISIDGKPVQSPEDVMNVVNSKEGSVPVRILRDKAEQTVNVDLGKLDEKVKEGKPESDLRVGKGNAWGLGSVSVASASAGRGASRSAMVFTTPGTSHSSCTVIVRGGCCGKMKAPKAPVPPVPPTPPAAPDAPAPPAQPMKAPTML